MTVSTTMLAFLISGDTSAASSGSPMPSSMVESLMNSYSSRAAGLRRCLVMYISASK